MTGWKQKLVHEIVQYGLNFVYLGFFLVAFTWYRRLIMAQYAIGYTDYWVPLVEAAVLAKVVMIGDIMRLGRGLQRTPLLVPTLYRTAVFTVFVGVFSVVEHAAGGLITGRGAIQGVAELAGKGLYELLAKCVIILCAFVPFFAFKELEGVIGEERLRDLFWRRVTMHPDPAHRDAGTRSGS